ncbi:MAG: Ig domain-containing protein [Acidobacteria bacterium]|nr:Ig domain-containing protein [Acidobacteriota bacterium]
MPSLLEATRLSLPSIPDFRLPSGGSVNTVFPAATGGAAPYSYGVSGLPPGISFHASTRGASGTLPTVASETTYWVTYGVTDGAGASASVSFSATVVPPPAPPPPPSPPPPPPLPPPSSLSLPAISDFTLPSGGSVDTVFPAATGGAPPYSYGVSGLPPGVTFAAGTRRASGTLPTVTVDTDYTVTYSVRDGAGATASVTFTTTVTAPPPTSGPVSPPGPPPQPADPPTVPVDAVRLHSLPFTVSETGSGQKEYRFRLESRTEVSVSLTGMDRDIDCRLNSARCTNHSGTRADSWSGTLEAGTHTVTVYPYNADSGSWTLSVSGTTTTTAPPPPTTPTPSPSPSPPTRVRRVLETRVGVVYAAETNSAERTYRFTLASSQTVSVSLTGMDRDIDCSVNGSRCSNRGGTRDDDWSGELLAGFHSIRVYPYRGGTGDWTVSVSVNCPAGHFALGGACYRYVVPEPPTAALGADGPELLSCDGDTELGEGQECVDGIVVFSEEIVVTSTPRIPVPPPGTSIPPPTAPTQPTTPTPPSFPRALWPQQLRDAVADAITKSETCSVRTNSGDLKNANAKLTAAKDAGRIVPGGPLCGGPRTVAHVDAVPGTTIHICSRFFGQSASERSLTIMHEGLHLEGVRHTDFGGADTAPDDDGPMDAAIRSACGYGQ